MKKFHKRIIVVDDDSNIILFFKLCLEENGFHVDTYTNPKFALSEFKSNFYDLILIDIRMPQMNGFQLYQKLREIDAAIKVCFITAFEAYYRAVKEEFRDLDIKCFIKKPITCDGLIIRLKAELEIQ